ERDPLDSRRRITNGAPKKFHQSHGLIGFKIISALLIRNRKTPSVISHYHQTAVKIRVQSFQQTATIEAIGSTYPADFLHQYLLLPGFRLFEIVRDFVITRKKPPQNHQYKVKSGHNRC